MHKNAVHTLTPNECRVLGVLVEKSLTTPEYYPLTINAVKRGANQRNCRIPNDLIISEGQCSQSLDRLRKLGLVDSGQGRRCSTWKHNLRQAGTELGVLAELLVRGPQTYGQLRSNLKRFGQSLDSQVLASLEAGNWLHQVSGKWAHRLAAEAPRARKNLDQPLTVELPWFSEMEVAVNFGFSIALMGPRGTGKTSAVKNLARRMGKALHCIQGHSDVTVEELRGEPGLKGGDSTFTSGLVVQAAERGDWALFDEANLGRPGVLAWMNNVLDEDGIISIPATHQSISVSKGFRAFFCFNAGYQGTRAMNEALLDRTRVIYCPYWTEEQELEALYYDLESNYRRPDRDLEELRSMIKIANSVRAARRKGTVDFDFSYRTLKQWAVDFYHRTNDIMKSFESVVLSKVGDPHEYGPQHEALRELAQLIIR